MIDLGYQFEGVEQVLARLSALRELRGLDSELEAEGDATLPVLRAYPPEVPEQRYVRKYRFRDSWKRQDARRTSKGVEVDLTNDTPYGPLLVGDDQAEPMKGRWWKLRTVADDRRGMVRARAQQWALRTWRNG